MQTPLLQAKGISKKYASHKGWFEREVIHAVKSVSFELNRGQTIAVVGETGSGKSTLAQLLSGDKVPDEGDILLHGQSLAQADLQQRSMDIRLIPQRPSESLNPRLRVGIQLMAPLVQNRVLSEPLRKEKMLATLKDVGLLVEHADYYPYMLSSNQRLRIALARALIVDPEVLVLDQTLSAIDVTMRAQLINLLSELQQSRGMAYVIIGHQLSMIRHLADEVLVMQQGEVIEQISAETLFTFEAPQHNYTRRLLQAFKELTLGWSS